jgi:hypothetical protein
MTGARTDELRDLSRPIPHDDTARELDDGE